MHNTSTLNINAGRQGSWYLRLWCRIKRGFFSSLFLRHYNFSQLRSYAIETWFFIVLFLSFYFKMFIYVCIHAAFPGLPLNFLFTLGTTYCAQRNVSAKANCVCRGGNDEYSTPKKRMQSYLFICIIITRDKSECLPLKWKGCVLLSFLADSKN